MDLWERIWPGLRTIRRKCKAPWTVEQIRGHLLHGKATLFVRDEGFIVLERCLEPWTGEPYLNAWLMWFKPGEAMKQRDELVEWLDNAVRFYKCAWWQFGSPREEWGATIAPYCEKALTVWRREPPVSASLTVFVVTWCKSEETYYGNSLVFESIRKGFPTAKVVVLDNNSEPALRERLAKLAAGVGATFIPMPREFQHWEILNQLALYERLDTNAVCFIDPDVIFWESVEDWTFGESLCAGRLLPAFQDEYTGTATMPRLHTSFLWLPDVAALRQRIAERRGGHFEFEPFRPFMGPMLGEWVRWDCAATLYGALKNRCHAFTEKQLDAYDHLFCGTHASIVKAAINNPRYAEIHAEAASGGRDLRGIWREQEAHFQSRPLKPGLRGMALAETFGDKE